MYGIYHRASQKLDPTVYSHWGSAEIDRRNHGSDAVTVTVTGARGHILDLVEFGAPGTVVTAKKSTE